MSFKLYFSLYSRWFDRNHLGQCIPEHCPPRYRLCCNTFYYAMSVESLHYYRSDEIKRRKQTTGSSRQHPQFRGRQSQKGQDTLWTNSKIWGLPLAVTLTCVDAVRPHSPQIPHLGSHGPLVRTLRLSVQTPNVGASQAPGTSQDCRKKYRVCLLYQHSSQRSQSASVYTLALLFFWKDSMLK